jgi:uncharacterized protein (DUF1015 family)
VKDYDTDVILKHEKTRPTKEDDRTRHIVSQRAHAEPVMLTFRDNEYVQAVLDETTASEPIYDFDSPDDIRHTIWNVRQPDRLVTAFSEIDKLYVADGHHRCKAASRAAEAMEDRTGVSDEVGFFPAVLFPMRSMRILAYNRIFRKLPDPTESFLRKLTAAFENEQASAPEPKARGEVCVYAGRRWTKIRLPPAGDSPIDALDVGRLSAQILEPMLGITDPRTDPNIDFVGGIRGTEELERIVDSGEAALAISMYPTSIEELVAVSDAGLLMPPKSTWFEPKLRSGLLVHLF